MPDALLSSSTTSLVSVPIGPLPSRSAQLAYPAPPQAVAGLPPLMMFRCSTTSLIATVPLLSRSPHLAACAVDATPLTARTAAMPATKPFHVVCILDLLFL